MRVCRKWDGIYSINVRKVGFKSESTEGKLHRARRPLDGIPQGIVPDDSIPRPLYESPRSSFVSVKEKRHAESVIVRFLSQIIAPAPINTQNFSK